MALQTAEKPLRADAERNRRRILDAARELFAERGLGVTLNDIAHHAGVGVGTVYRRFPVKTELIESLFEESFAQITARMDAALADPDPWHGLLGFFDGQFQAQTQDRALKELVTAAPEAMERVARLRDELLPRSAELVTRAQANGTLRADIEPADLAVVQLMIGAVLDASRDTEPELWRRYLGILVRGLSARPDSLGPLAGPTLDPDQIDAVMTAHKRAGH